MVNTYRQYIDYNLLDSTILLIGIIKAHKGLKYHLETILNFFIKLHTNANAESFNSKIKL
jgi:hypothetical protein